MRNKTNLFKFVSSILLLINILGSVLTVQASPIMQDDGPEVISSESEVVSPYFTIVTDTYSDGTTATSAIINGPPEPLEGYDLGLAMKEGDLGLETSSILSDFPSYSWVFGCSAVSGGMMAGYYDRHGFPNMYIGPTNGGLMPLTDTSWPKWYSPDYDTHDPYPNNPLIASHKGIDGRTIRGSIDDYWWSYGSTKKDPYILGGWTQHVWATAIGDYMKTSQSKYDLTDGATRFYWNLSYYGDGKLTCGDMVSNGYNEDGTLGIRAFYKKRGYNVTDCYSQVIDTYMAKRGLPGGFTLADYKAQIDAGHPVLINVMGHSMVGYGYGTGDTIYIRNTWDNNQNNIYSMQWGGLYSGMEHYQVVVVNPEKPTLIPTPLLPVGATSVHKPVYKWTKVNNATDYIIRVNQGTTNLFTRNVSAANVCDATTCQIRPDYFLKDGYYRWHVRAKVNGIWRPLSAFKNFNVATSFDYQFNSSSDLALWNTVVGSWSLNNGWYRTNGVYPYWNSIFHEGRYPRFEYTVRMNRVNNQNNSNTIFVRGTPYPLQSDADWHNFYELNYTNSGYFSVWKSVNGTETALKGWTTTPAINKNGWNVLKVIGIGPTLKFYINNQLVWNGSDSSLGTGRVGIAFVKPALGWEPLLVDLAKLNTDITISSDADVWAEIGETNTEWNDSSMSPPEP